ncbi:DUF6286 domain-containing protein [Streptomyces sp. NPDC060194]|uniref:DUF6286 domain-containing protein n=1 Tax=Streptomyces sp. NPDC060194 TaxID=3347069 RepID=UPI00365E398F
MSEPGVPQGATQRLPVLEKHPPPYDEQPYDDGLPYDDTPRPDRPAGGRAHRFRSPRRITAAVAALLLLGALGLLLYDVVQVRAGEPGMAWRRELADALATRQLDSWPVLLGAGLAAALGIWMLVLALTPGLRELLPMKPVHPDVRAVLERRAAALVLRERAGSVPGVESVTVRTGRRKADVRAVSHFRDLDEVRADLESAVAAGVEDLGVVRPPKVTVQVRRSGGKVR